MAFNIYEWRRNQLLLEEVMNESKGKALNANTAIE